MKRNIQKIYFNFIKLEAINEKINKARHILKVGISNSQSGDVDSRTKAFKKILNNNIKNNHIIKDSDSEVIIFRCTSNESCEKYILNLLKNQKNVDPTNLDKDDGAKCTESFYLDENDFKLLFEKLSKLHVDIVNCFYETDDENCGGSVINCFDEFFQIENYKNVSTKNYLFEITKKDNILRIKDIKSGSESAISPKNNIIRANLNKKHVSYSKLKEYYKQSSFSSEDLKIECEKVLENPDSYIKQYKDLK